MLTFGGSLSTIDGTIMQTDAIMLDKIKNANENG